LGFGLHQAIPKLNSCSYKVIVN